MTESTENPKTEPPEIKEEEPISTSHQLELADATGAYTATVGKMPLKDEKEKIVAQIFYTAYTLDSDDRAARPLIFVFNGGPGSASIWLHMGGLGPKRVDMGAEGFMPPPPYKLIDNAHTWLDLGDLVFIDPVGTGYSRAVDPDDSKKYWGLEADLEAVGEFIRLYLSRNQRWTSPLFLAGESYGTTRAAGLAGHLIDRGIAFSGIILISTILNFQTTRFTKANDLPYTLFLPSFCASAYYHGALEAELQGREMRGLLHEVAEWAEGEYTVALAKGDRLSDEERQSVAERLARYTGLSTRFILGADLRINIMSFCKELLRDEKRALGRLDSRFVGIMASAEGTSFDFDPASYAILAPYTAVYNQYVRETLAYETDLNYEVMSRAVIENWKYQGGRFPDTSEGLRAAFAKNPFMRVLVAQGYYDLATPFQAAYYSLAHMGLDRALRDNVSIAEYEAGHMMYLHEPSLAKLKADAATFIRAG